MVRLDQVIDLIPPNPIAAPADIVEGIDWD